MNTTKEWNCLIAAWLTLFLGLVIRLVLSGHFLLVPDEANYWQWSRYLALGYQDHPPMIAWTIWLATKLFGQNEFAVRLPSILGLTVASCYIVALAMRWFSCRIAFHVALLSQGLLLFNGTALISTPDGLLLPCWAGACYHGGQALKHNRFGQWMLTGIWFGLGLLSKYTIILFLPSLLLSVILIKPYRRRLSQAAPWIGLLLSIVIFTPVLIWNKNNEWVTFRHVLYMGGLDEHGFFSTKYIVDFFLEQTALLSPVVLLMIWSAWLTGPEKQTMRQPEVQYLVWTSLTTFVVFFLLSLHSRVYGNWPAPGYLSAVVLIAALYSPGRGRFKDKKNGIWILAVTTAYLMTIPVLIQVLTPLVPVPVDLDRTARETVGWDKLGQTAHKTLKTMPRPDNTFIFGIRYQIASELAFYMPGRPRTVAINRWTRPNVYDFWFTDDMLVGRDGLGVTEHRETITLLKQIFDRVDPPQVLPIYRDSPWYGRELIKTFYIFRAYGFKGGLRWRPRDHNDIRATDRQTGH